jgi:calcineurin-like phosphoesterase family protein
MKVMFRAAAAVLLLAAPLPPTAAASRPSCEVEGVERIVAVGDVHGAYDRFVEILQTAGIIDERQHWTAGKTHLVQLGDILDRGGDSRKALDLIRTLTDEASRAGGAVHELLGNHEVMRMLGDLRYTSPGEYAAFVNRESEVVRTRFGNEVKDQPRDQALAKIPLGLIEMRVAFGREGEYGRALRRLDTTVRINGIVFVHGGISPAVAPMRCDEINDRVRKDLTGDLDKTRATPLTSLAARVDGPLWYRGLTQEPDTFAHQVDEILAGQHASAVVVGHTVTTDGRVRARFGGKVIQIDTGMQPAYIEDGRAAALEIRNGVFTAIYRDRSDVVAR